MEATMHPKTFTGTSGYSYEDWRGLFYPARLAKGKMLDTRLRVSLHRGQLPFYTSRRCGWWKEKLAPRVINPEKLWTAWCEKDTAFLPGKKSRKAPGSGRGCGST
ncbi:MAG: hypothetical protein AB1330_02705 [Bacillota bacterium]